MNRSFKVVFNKTRGALMVVNEITSSVQAKGTKTVIATAVASVLMAGSALANTPETEVKVLDWDTITTPTDTYKHPTFKLHSGKGQETHINTNANAGVFIADVLKAKTKDELLKALGQVDSTNKTGIVTGFAGGQNYWDASTGKTQDIVDVVLKLPKFGDTLKEKLGDYLPIVDKLGQQLSKLEVEKDEINKIEHDTHVIIGGKPDNSPVLVGSVGGDRLLNANLNVDLSSNDNGVNLALIMAGLFVPNGTNSDLTFTRVGNTLVDVKSGNLFGHINGSSAINVGEILTVSASLEKEL